MLPEATLADWSGGAGALVTREHPTRACKGAPGGIRPRCMAARPAGADLPPLRRERRPRHAVARGRDRANPRSTSAGKGRAMADSRYAAGSVLSRPAPPLPVRGDRRGGALVGLRVVRTDLDAASRLPANRRRRRILRLAGAGHGPGARGALGGAGSRRSAGPRERGASGARRPFGSPSVAGTMGARRALRPPHRRRGA